MRATGSGPRARAGQSGDHCFVSLNLNPHLHLICIDGVYARPAPTAVDTTPPLVFCPLAPPSIAEVEQVSAGTCRRVVRLLERRGLATDEGLIPQDELTEHQRVADLAPRQPSLFARVDAEGRVERIRPTARPPRAGEVRGFSVHAGVSAGAGDAERRRRIVRYCLRPPFADGSYCFTSMSSEYLEPSAADDVRHPFRGTRERERAVQGPRARLDVSGGDARSTDRRALRSRGGDRGWASPQRSYPVSAEARRRLKLAAPSLEAVVAVKITIRQEVTIEAHYDRTDAGEADEGGEADASLMMPQEMMRQQWLAPLRVMR